MKKVSTIPVKTSRKSLKEKSKTIKKKNLEKKENSKNFIKVEKVSFLNKK